MARSTLLSNSGLLSKGIGLGTWGLVTLPLWGALVAPFMLAWLVLLFNAYWLLRSSMLGFGAIVSYRRLRKAERTDWLALAQEQPGFDGVHHLVIVPTYKEDDAVLAETLDHLVRQDFPAERIAVVLAFEARDAGAQPGRPGCWRATATRFGQMWALFHQIRPGEVAGKSSNLAWAAPRARTLLLRRGIDPSSVLVTICDADSRLHAKYLSALAHDHLSDPEQCRAAVSAGPAVPREPGSAAAAAPRHQQRLLGVVVGAAGARLAAGAPVNVLAAALAGAPGGLLGPGRDLRGFAALLQGAPARG